MPLGERDVVRRLLQRVGLGPRRGELDAGTRAGFEATLTGLTAPSGHPDAGAAATPVPAYPPPSDPAGAAAQPANRQAEAAQAEALVLWWLDRMAAVDSPFPERLAWFWHGHFATSVRKVRRAELMLKQNETMRGAGGGDFRELARAMVTDPAMLIWLDGVGNRVGKPNENLARELMELFTLGVNNYTEADVREAARALTGWRVDATSSTAGFVARLHDGGSKSVLGTTAALDAPALVDLLVSQPASPRFLAARVWTRFVSDAAPDPASLDALLAGYGPGRDFTGLLRAAVRTPAFHDPASVLVRQPVEWLVGGLRALKVRASALPAPTLRTGLAGVGQTPFAPPDVGGWPAGAAWLTTAAALARLKLAQAMAAAGDLSPVTDASRGARVDAAAELLGVPPWTDRTRAALAQLADQPAQLVALALTSPENTVSA
jgi:uncharacterized protein (DUF1800 family)